MGEWVNVRSGGIGKLSAAEKHVLASNYRFRRATGAQALIWRMNLRNLVV